MSDTRVEDRPNPTPGPGEVRVQMRAVSLNPVDWKLCVGVAPWWTEPMIVGVDGAGVVDALGEGVEGVAIGDRVVWHHNLSKQGVFADYAIAPSHVLARIPDSVSDEAAAALPCAGMTAYQGLVRKARLGAGETVLIQGASGGTGGFALQIAKALGATTIALARTKDHDRVRALGADHVLDYTADDLHDQVRAIAPDGVDLMYEVVKAKDANVNFRHIRYNGQFVTTDPLPDLSNVPAYTYALSMHEVALGGAYGASDMRTQKDFAVMLEAMLEMVAQGTLDPMIEAEIGFDDIPKYLGRLMERKVTGKIVARL
ncbi:zinc-binding dehydrogenase [Paracoccus homiensis]|uniref:zinc-binding dehydrogenase n=1 Tax=Paracoccus homiensis TaxID=364199 RepID=UPI001C317183|nr:zinc-binding dehydrogenase [Paracoccus homiensis]